jgi:hypothetical protein
MFILSVTFETGKLCEDLRLCSAHVSIVYRSVRNAFLTGIIQNAKVIIRVDHSPNSDHHADFKCYI